MDEILIEKLKANIEQLYSTSGMLIKRSKRKKLYEEAIQIINTLNNQNIDLQDTVKRLRNQLRKNA